MLKNKKNFNLFLNDVLLKRSELYVITERGRNDTALVSYDTFCFKPTIYLLIVCCKLYFYFNNFLETIIKTKKIHASN